MSETKPTYLDLLQRRIDAGARREARHRISLAPELFAAYEAAKAAVAGMRGNTDDDKPAKMSSALVQATRDRDRLAEQIRESTIVVVMRSKEGAEMARLVNAAPEAGEIVAERWRRICVACYDHAESLDGERLDGIDAAQFEALWGALGFGEQQALFTALEDSLEEPDFPTFGK